MFAGANGPDRRLKALSRVKVDALLGSFTEVRRSREVRTARYLEIMDSWPQYRFLDSGMYTFMSRNLERREGLTRANIAAREKRKDEVKTVSTREVVGYVHDYLAYLEQNLDTWDFVFECDLDPISLTTESGSTMPGRELTAWAREKLRAVAGERLIPVWHTVTENLATMQNVIALVEDYRFIGVGSSRKGGQELIRRACDVAHRRGVLVHGLGTTKEDALRDVPYDTVDSSHWISGGKFGMYGKIVYTDRRELSARELRKARSFEEQVRALGYNPEDIVGSTPNSHIQYEIGAALLLARQNAAPSVKPPREQVESL